MPPTVEDAGRLLEAARNRDPDFGALLWVVMITGIRRGELCALRWSHVRLDSGELLISRSCVQSGSGTREKDTKGLGSVDLVVSSEVDGLVASGDMPPGGDHARVV